MESKDLNLRGSSKDLNLGDPSKDLNLGVPSKDLHLGFLNYEVLGDQWNPYRKPASFVPSSPRPPPENGFFGNRDPKFSAAM